MRNRRHVTSNMLRIYVKFGDDPQFVVTTFLLNENIPVEEIELTK